jgi:hypothetical protein
MGELSAHRCAFSPFRINWNRTEGKKRRCVWSGSSQGQRVRSSSKDLTGGPCKKPGCRNLPEASAEQTRGHKNAGRGSGLTRTSRLLDDLATLASTRALTSILQESQISRGPAHKPQRGGSLISATRSLHENIGP